MTNRATAVARARIVKLEAELSAWKNETKHFTPENCRNGIHSLLRRAESVEHELEMLKKAAVAYDDAIRSCANDPEKMSSFCSAQGDDLDTLYAAWISLARK